MRPVSEFENLPVMPVHRNHAAIKPCCRQRRLLTLPSLVHHLDLVMLGFTKKMAPQIPDKSMGSN